jgi:ankyrin repeat protein
MVNMTQTLQRRRLLAFGPAVASGVVSPATFAQAPEATPPVQPDLVKAFVSKSHADLLTVRDLVKQEPMLARASWDWGGGDSETGLGAASHMGRRDIAQFLIDNGARVDVFAVFMLGEMTPAKALLSAFPAIHKTPGPHGISLLSHTIVGKKPAFAAFMLLIEAGADVNAAAWRGATPLMQAVAAEEVDMVRTLLDRGANPSAKTPSGQTALDLARKKNATAIIAILEKS